MCFFLVLKMYGLIAPENLYINFPRCIPCSISTSLRFDNIACITFHLIGATHYVISTSPS